MRILGIDPGLATVGWGVIDVVNGNAKAVSFGVISTPKEDKLPVRLSTIESDLKCLIDRFKPDEIAIEELFFNSNTTTAINVAQARGVILLTSNKYCKKMFEYTPLQIKQALTGYGRAEKKQIQEMTKTLLNLPKIPRPDDAADALAVALTHSQTNRLSGEFKIR